MLQSRVRRIVAWSLLLSFPAALFAAPLQTFDLVPVPGPSDGKVIDVGRAGPGDPLASVGGSHVSTTSNVAGAARSAAVAAGGRSVGRNLGRTRRLSRMLKMAGFAAGGGGAAGTGTRASGQAQRAPRLRASQDATAASRATGGATPASPGAESRKGSQVGGGRGSPGPGGSLRSPGAPGTSGVPPASGASGSSAAGGASSALGKKLGMSSNEVRRLQGYLKSSPVAAELRMPFAPSNILFAVGATAGMTVFSQMGQEGDGVDLGKALSFLGDANFWGGLVGSGVGYSLASIVAMSLVPAGAGLLPVVMPMFAGMAGSIFGWELGSHVFQEGGWREALEGLDPTRVLGQAAGTTAGLMVGANLATMVGGSLAAVAGPVGAIVGALVLGNVGARVGEALKGFFTGEEAEAQAALQEVGGAFRKTEALLGKMGEVGSALAEVVPESLPSANIATESLPARLVSEYRDTYEELRQALVEGDRARAHHKLEYLQHLRAAYSEEVGEALQGMARGR